MSWVALQYLESIFGWVWAASWQASVLALLVLFLRWAFGARLNPRWGYALWLLVLARLVLPALPESAWSVFQFAPAPPATIVEPVTEPLFVSASLPSPSLPAPLPITEPIHPVSLYSLLAMVWLAGAAFLFFLTWRANWQFSRQIACSPQIADPALLEIFAAAKAELGISRSIRLIENNQVQSPAIMGLFQPTLLLPADVREKFDARELRFIFLHELAHLKRGDVAAQALIALLQILHWFNPVLWFAFRRMRADREPATDALVLSRTGESEKEPYGLMLIKLLEHFNQRHALPTLVGVLEDRDQFKRRFSLIAKFTRGAYGWSLLGILLITVLAIVCLTKAKTANASNSPAVETTKQNAEPSGDMVRVSVKVIQIGESDYQAHQGEIDAAVEKGDVAALTGLNLKSFHLTGDLFALSKLGEQSVIESVRVLKFPDNDMKDSNGTLVPKDSRLATLGIRFVSKSTINKDDIDVAGTLEIRSLEGWSQEKDAIPQAHFHDRRYTSLMGFPSGYTWGLQVPGGAQMEPLDPTLVFGPDKIPSPSENPKNLARYFAIFNATLYSHDGKPILGKLPTSEDTPDKSTASANSQTATVPQDLDKLKKDLLTAKEDADARHVLLEKTANLPDSEFVATLTALGRAAPAVAALQADIDNQKAVLDQLRKDGFADNHPRVQELNTELADKQKRLKDLVDGLRQAVAIDSKMGDSRVALLKQEVDDAASKSGGTVTAASAYTISAADELVLHQKNLQAAKQDADARHTLLAETANLPDDQFVSTLQALGRLDPNITALQTEIDQTNTDISNLLKDGFAKDHPRIQEMRSELTAKKRRIKDLIYGMRQAMALDSQMAYSRVALLTHEVNTSAVQPSPNQASTQTAYDLKVTLVEIPKKDYEANSAAMDAAVRDGNLQYFIDRKAATKADTISLKAGKRGWIEMGVARPMPQPAAAGSGQVTTESVFLGLYGDFLLNSDKTIDSTWQITEELKATPGTPPPLQVKSTPDTGWNVVPGKVHSYWLGETRGDIQKIARGWDIDVTRSRALSRLAVFVTANPNEMSDAPSSGEIIEVPKAGDFLSSHIWPPADLDKTIGFTALEALGEINPSADPALNATIDNLKLATLDLPKLPLHLYLNEMAKALKKQNPESQQISFILTCPAEDQPYPITFHLQHPSTLREVLTQLSAQYPLRYQIRGATDIIVWQVSHFETDFKSRAAQTTIDLNLDHATLAEALKAVQDAAATKGFIFEIANFDNAGLFPADAPRNITLQQHAIPLDQALRYILITSKTRLVYERYGIDKKYTIAPALSDFPIEAITSPPLIAPQSSMQGPVSPYQDITISGKAGFTHPELVDLEKSTGYLEAVAPASAGTREFHFASDGSFTLPHVVPGLYKEHVHLVRKDSNPPESVDMPLAPLMVDGNAPQMISHLNLDVPFKGVAKGLVEIGLKVIEISDDLYQQNKKQFDDAVETGDIAPFVAATKGVNILASPSVSTRPGTKASVEVVREFPYPIKFDPAAIVDTPPSEQTTSGEPKAVYIPATPNEFVTKDVGITADITPSLNAGKILLSGKFTLTNFDGFIDGDAGVKSPAFSTSESNLYEAVDNKQLKGIWIPGMHVDMPKDKGNQLAGNPLPTPTEPVKLRYLLFLSADLRK